MPGTNLKIFCTTGWKSLAVFIKSWREAGECQSVMDFFCKYHSLLIGFGGGSDSYTHRPSLRALHVCYEGARRSGVRPYD
jgi:hypothetical protein